MIYQPPAGARDLLPLDVAQKRWIEDRLQQVFHRWGYQRIITSTLERLDTLVAGGAIDHATVLKLQDTDEDGLGLRPEVTASIARAAVTRLANATLPLRLYYNANVFRRALASSYSGQKEFYQAGVELLGASGVMADAEVLLLLIDCLRSLNLEHWTVVIGEASLTRSLLSEFPPVLQPKLRYAIAHLDRIALTELPLSPDLRDRALLLMDLRGQPAAVLEQVSQLPLDSDQRAIVDHLQSLTELFQAAFAHQRPTASSLPLILDLSLIRTFDYYTGLVFEVVGHMNGSQYVLGQGGRYDQLLGVYHPQGQSQPGIGFCLQIESLHQLLSAIGHLPQQTSTPDWLVVPASSAAYSAAFAYAAVLRSSTAPVHVELELSNRSQAEIYDYARHRRIARIAWVKPSGDPVIEPVSYG